MASLKITHRELRKEHFDTNQLAPICLRLSRQAKQSEIAQLETIPFGLLRMRTYPLDIDPGQVVRWIIEEHRAAPSRFRIAAWRGSEVQDIPARGELHLDDEEREDLSEVDTIATLEIAPAHASEGWLLTVEVEDEAGPRLLDKGPLVEGEGEIDLGRFYDEFIRPGRGIANVFAAVDNDAAEVRLNELVSSIEQNLHGPNRARGRTKL